MLHYISCYFLFIEPLLPASCGMGGVYLNFLIYAVSCFSLVLFIVKYVPETKGKSLQEIQDLLNKTDTNP